MQIGLILLLLFMASTSARAEPPSNTLDTPGCLSQAAGFLEGRLGIWQQRLKLGGWKISLALSHPSELKPKTLGNIHWDTVKKTAVIRVLDASDYQVSCHDALADMEVTVVHELVHLDLSSLPRPVTSRRDEEMAVNRLADALVKLDRANAVTPAVSVPTW
jgi:hypothetical protein